MMIRHMLAASEWANKWIRLSIVTAWFAVIAGCATTSNTPDENFSLTSELERLAAWENNKVLLNGIQSWNLSGKLGIKSGRKGGSATLKWRYSPENQEIELHGPLGGGRVIIIVDENGAVLRDTKGKVITGETATEVLYKRLGWHVPFDQLAYWARGLPSEGKFEKLIGDRGQLSRLIQGNWDVDYQTYKFVVTKQQTYNLPAKLVISALPGTIEVYSKSGKYIGDELDVKVILKRWWNVKTVTPQ